MNATTMPASGPAAAREITDRCHIYKEEFGLDTVPDPESGVIHLMATSVSGVMVTPALGRAVAGEVDAVPVFSINPHGHRLWVLLADAPASSDDVERIAYRLFKCGAVAVFPRTTIALPTPGEARRVWLYPPRGLARPALSTLVDAIADAAINPARPPK